MYSVVLMMALNNGGGLPACHRGYDWCGGCYDSCGYYDGCGCYGGWSYGCCGCYGGYYGGWSYGCDGYGGYSYSNAYYAAPATIVVSLPADAKLTIDDAPTVSTSARRVFKSPDLAMGQEFHYTLKAEFSRDGKRVVVSKQVVVRAGVETDVTIEADAAGVASK